MNISHDRLDILRYTKRNSILNVQYFSKTYYHFSGPYIKCSSHLENSYVCHVVITS
jgi:hypothetical protein